jgi:hypothetical protein
MRWREPAATVNYTLVISSERALQNKKPEKKLVSGAGGGLTPRLTGRLTVGRNVTSTSTSTMLNVAVIYVGQIECNVLLTDINNKTKLHLLHDRGCVIVQSVTYPVTSSHHVQSDAEIHTPMGNLNVNGEFEDLTAVVLG